MKAAVYRKYGPPEVLMIEDIERAPIQDDEVLVKVHSASVNPLDYKIRKNILPVRLISALLKPKAHRVGVDVAGEVEAVGEGVTRFKKGDPVFGYGRGSCAEFMTGPHEKLALKPKNVSFNEAAAVPVAALTALQGLRNKGGIKKSDNVLIYGASGGVGHIAVQIAKALGARVTAVCSTPNLKWVKALGADEVVDYTREDFTERGETYDIIFDTVGYAPYFKCRPCLTESGVYVTANFMNKARDIIEVPLGMLFRRKGAKFFITRGNRADFEFLVELMGRGKLKPHIDRRYPLGQIVEAHRYAEKGHTKGKVVIEIIK